MLPALSSYPVERRPHLNGCRTLLAAYEISKGDPS